MDLAIIFSMNYGDEPVQLCKGFFLLNTAMVSNLETSWIVIISEWGRSGRIDLGSSSNAHSHQTKPGYGCIPIFGQATV